MCGSFYPKVIDLMLMDLLLLAKINRMAASHALFTATPKSIVEKYSYDFEPTEGSKPSHNWYYSI